MTQPSLPEDILIKIALCTWKDNISLSRKAREYVQKKRLSDLQTLYPGILKANKKAFKLISNNFEALQFLVTLPLSHNCLNAVAITSAKRGYFNILKRTEHLGANDFHKTAKAAAKGRHWDIVNHVTNRFINIIDNIVKSSSEDSDERAAADAEKLYFLGKISNGAAQGGYFDTVKIAYASTTIDTEGTFIDFDAAACKAAKRGDLNSVKLAVNKGEGIIDINSVAQNAAYGGYLDIIEWSMDQEDVIADDIAIHAARGGHFDIAKWAIEQGATVIDEVSRYAAKFGRFDIVKWSIDEGASDLEGIATFAAEGGHLNIVEWITEQESIELYNTLLCGAQEGHFHIVKWILDQSFEIPLEVALHAAIRGHLNIVKVLDHHEKSDFDRIAEYGAKGGYLDIVEWAIDKGAKNFNDIAICAMEGGNVDVVKLALTKGAHNYNIIANMAARRGYLDIVKLTKDHMRGFGGIAHYAAEEGCINIVKWAIEQGAKITTHLSKGAARSRKFNIIEWLLNNKSICSDQLLYLSLESRFRKREWIS